MMLFTVKYTAGKFSGARMVNATSEEHALVKVQTRLREELPAETAKSETYRIVQKGEALDV